MFYKWSDTFGAVNRHPCSYHIQGDGIYKCGGQCPLCSYHIPYDGTIDFDGTVIFALTASRMMGMIDLDGTVIFALTTSRMMERWIWMELSSLLLPHPG